MDERWLRVFESAQPRVTPSRANELVFDGQWKGHGRQRIVAFPAGLKGWINSGPQSVVMTGSPMAIASIVGKPQPSACVGRTKASAEAYSEVSAPRMCDVDTTEMGPILPLAARKNGLAQVV